MFCFNSFGDNVTSSGAIFLMFSLSNTSFLWMNSANSYGVFPLSDFLGVELIWEKANYKSWLVILDRSKWLGIISLT